MPFKEKDKIYKAYHETVDQLFKALNMSAARRRLDNFKNNLKNDAKEGGQGLSRERERLVRAYESKRSEIKTYENNLGFLTCSSKKGSSLLNEMNKKMEKSYQKVGIVKYDAFNEMGGKLSFALAMLDNNNTGWILNAMHSREGCYTYVKEIVKGESYVELAEEEAEALDKAIFEDGYEEEVNKAVASVTGSMKMAKSGPAKTGNQKNSNARSAKQVSGKANNGKILNTRTSSMRPDMARPEKNRK